ncbi:MAG: glycerol kinase GlpK [Luminiphilus sp.]|nr:glycerol kinase GlpK [Luminiphilus sp.]MDG2037387.1 glycerol kinase GlpK [Luminiphilus sp.]
MKAILAIDQGTTGTTVAVMNTRGALLGSVNYEFPQIYPKPGWVEHDAEAIWATVLKGIRAVFRKGLCRPADVACIGITNQRETALLWERRTGKPLGNAIVWQCRRTASFCEGLRKKGLEPMVRDRTGLVLDPYFSASKFRWLLNDIDGARGRARRGEIVAGTIDCYLLARLTGGVVHATDVSNASRTSLMNLGTLDWDPDLLKLFNVPRNLLPDIIPSSGDLGRTLGMPGLPDGIPITGIAGDQQSALFGQAGFDRGAAKCTFGTGSFILMNTGHDRMHSDAGLLSTVAWQLPGQKTPVYALEGGAFICGAAVQWLRDELGIIKRAADIEKLAAGVSDAGGLEFVPALTGLGAPHWDPDARGVISGLTRGASAAHLARATLEAMALQNVDILRAMERDLGRRMGELKVDGGAAANNLLMQLQANYLGRDIMRPKVIETTVAGACFLAGLGVGIWKDTDSLAKVWRADRRFPCRMSSGPRRRRLEAWQRAVNRAKTTG